MKAKKVAITKEIDPEYVFCKLAAFGEIFINLLNEDVNSTSSGSVTVGLNNLFNETLVELEIIIFGERYLDSSYVDDVKIL